MLAGYDRRSLGETGFYRWKIIFGKKLQSRKLVNQQKEVYAKSMALNELTAIGVPKGCVEKFCREK